MINRSASRCRVENSLDRHSHEPRSSLLYVSSLGDFSVEDTSLVTETGCESFNTLPAD